MKGLLIAFIVCVCLYGGMFYLAHGSSLNSIIATVVQFIQAVRV